MWVAFGKWLGFKEPITKSDVQKHLKTKWKKLQHATKLQQNTENLKVPKIITVKKEKKQLIKSIRNNNVKQLHYITRLECIVDQDNRTLVHLEELDDYNAIIEATNAVTNYYFHMIAQPTHRSENFWKNLTEHFGAYANYTILPYTSSDLASSHNIDHLECVNNLIYALQPLSNSINRFVGEYYEHYYLKLSKLTLGPFVPKPFGIFPMIAINFNVISEYHWDENDVPNGLCFLVALGNFEGGELHFPQLNIVVKLSPGQVVAFPSYLLLHGNFTVTKGIRFSIVYFVHSYFFHHLRNFTKINEKYKNEKEADKKANIIRVPVDFTNAKGLNKPKKLTKPQQFQVKEYPVTDQRRNNNSK